MIVLFGCILGIITGLIPGLGLFTGLLLVYPLISSLNAYDLIIFYISMAAASQYVGSISALILRIPGEANSIFALKEAPMLNQQNKIGAALGSTALGSMFGGIGAIILTAVLLTFLESFMPYFFRSDIKTIILFLSICIFVWFSGNKKIINFVFAVMGFLISMIGIGILGQERTFGFDFLLSGVSWYPLILGIWILPQLYNEEISFNRNVVKPEFYWNTGVVLRSTFIGYIGGLIPGISYIIGGKLSWLLENKISSDGLKRLLAAETANNASSYSMIIPLLLLGVPIVNSEALILELVNNKGFQFNWNSIVSSGWFVSSIIPIVFVNIVLAIVSIYGVRYLTLWVYIPKIKVIISSVLLLSLYMTTNNLVFDSCVFLVSLILGMILRNHDTSPIVLTMLLGDQLEHNLTRLYYIYQ